MAHLSGIDLNLLPLLDALITERQVTRAGRRVGLSQPAASRGLARLRSLLGDPLVIRVGATLRLTPRAEAVRGAVRSALGLVETALAPPAPFDPRAAQRTVRVAADDYSALVVLAPLMARLTTRAPGVHISVIPGREHGFMRLARGDVDLHLAPVGERCPPGVHVEPLGDDRLVCMVSREHPFARRAPTLRRYVAARHALIAPTGARGGMVDDALAAIGLERRVALLLPHFLVMPFFIVATDLVLTLAERVAQTFAGILPVTLFAPPLEVPTFTTGLFWHERDVGDPLLAWLRGELAAVGKGLAKRRPDSRQRRIAHRGRRPAGRRS